MRGVYCVEAGVVSHSASAEERRDRLALDGRGVFSGDGEELAAGAGRFHSHEIHGEGAGDGGTTCYGCAEQLEYANGYSAHEMTNNQSSAN